ncbi:MAG: polysaccharide lyase 6 family protein [Maricaulaceae bacterium]
MAATFSRLAIFSLVITVFSLSTSTVALAKDYLVDTQKDYKKAVKKIKAGDTIILKDGVWKDFKIIFQGQGRKDAKLTLRAQTPGGVTLTGQSNLRIGGAFLQVSGLTFKDGYSPSRDVIDMRSPNYSGAAFSELSHILIDGYNKPGTDEKDYWINFRGVGNRLTHSALQNKTSFGATVIFTQTLETTIPGQHLIKDNYFGPREPLGKNGGETIRIGVGKVAHQRFDAKIIHNYFERCNGEAEIISIKSGGNIIKENMFVETSGAITFRQGDDNRVERNVFLGNRAKGTGGVRLTSFNQTVRDNYFEGLRGDDGRSAVTFMGGFSDTLPVHYRQVQNAVIETNSFIDIETLTIGLEGDKDGDWPPLESRMSRNLFANPSGHTGSHSVKLDVHIDMDGLSFDDNHGNIKGLEDIQIKQDKSLTLSRGENGLYYINNKPELAAIGAPLDLVPFLKDSVGPSYFWAIKPR